MYYVISNKLEYYLARMHTQILKKRFFAHIGKKTTIYSPMRIVNPQNISIGDNVTIERNSTLYSVGKYQGVNHQGEIFIGNNVYINYGFNATAARSITIEDDVLCGFNVSIFDFNHDYEDIHSNINSTNLKVKGSIVIGEKSWLGMNVSILGSVKIGKHCIIGANAVITGDVPDYSIVAGNPARIIKHYNALTNIWEKV